MQRLVLAIILIAALAVVLAVLALGLRATMADNRASGTSVPTTGADGMQKIAFALLMALIAYVAFVGGA